MGILILLILLTIEATFFIWSVTSKDHRGKERAIVSLALLTLIGVLLGTGVLQGTFRYGLLLMVLLIQGIAALLLLIKKKEKAYTMRTCLTRLIGATLLFVFALTPAILFPQYTLPAQTGTYQVLTARHTWTDEARAESFSSTGGNRALTVEFWYPESTGETFPLIVFSHGAFGFSGSNHSTFAELASNGYVVASIGHTYHAFFTRDTSGTVTTADMAFIEQASALNASHDTTRQAENFQTTSEWMALRIADEAFVLDTILAACEKEKADALYSSINPERIGLMGHSLGGATSAQTGRLRDDINAVIVLDGTMLGETLAVENNVAVRNNTPYPIPLLNLYAEDHYTNAKTFEGDAYANFYATRIALNAQETVFRNAGHLNFTDLPLFSPALASMLGVGTVDARSCIETMNRVVLGFFDCHLKGAAQPDIAAEY